MLQVVETGGGEGGDGKLIRQTRRERGLSQREIAEAVGISQAAVEKIEAGKTQRSRYVADILRVLGLKEQGQRVPVVGYTELRDRGFVFQDTGETVTGPLMSTAKTVAVRIRSEGNPFDGWLLFYDDSSRPVEEPCINHMCVLALNDGRVMFRVLKRSTSLGLYHLVSAFGEPPITDVIVTWGTKPIALIP